MIRKTTTIVTTYAGPDNTEFSEQLHHLMKFVVLAQRYTSTIDGRIWRLKSDGTEASNAIWKDFVQDTFDFRKNFVQALGIIQDLNRIKTQESEVIFGGLTPVSRMLSPETRTPERLFPLSKPVSLSKIDSRQLIASACEKYGVNASQFSEAESAKIDSAAFKALHLKLDSLIKDNIAHANDNLEERVTIMKAAKSTGDGAGKMGAAGWLQIISAVAEWIIDNWTIIKEWFAKIWEAFTRDKAVRDAINTSGCDELRALSTTQIDEFLDALLSGITGDSDEEAVLRLIECLGADRVRSDVWPRWGDEILDKFHGGERDRLYEMLEGFGILNYPNWDDKQTKLFLNNADCSTLNSLRISDIRQLVLNLFEGWTTNSEEEAILDLLGCLPCTKVRELLSMPDVGKGDFDRNFQGGAQRDLDDLLEGCGV